MKSKKFTRKILCDEIKNFSILFLLLIWFKSKHTLKAEVDHQMCIPAEWYKIDFYYGSIRKGQKQLPVYEWISALAKLHAEIKYNYIFYDRYKQQIDSAYNKILPVIAVSKDNYEAMQLLKRFVATCHDGHTHVYHIGMMERPNFSPFTTKLLDNRVYIDKVGSSELEKAGMKPGMEIKKINCIPVHQYADSLLRPYISASTPQWADHEIFDGYMLSTGRGGAPLNLTLSNGKETIEIKHTIGQGRRDIYIDEDETVSFKKLNKNIGLLRIPDFQSSSVAKNFDELYDKILETDALIIDIRGNGGGNSNYGYHIASHFSADSIKCGSWRSPVYIPAFASWGKKRDWYEGETEYIQPVSSKRLYLKPVVILIDRGTFSAAEDFAELFKGMHRAKFVGTPSGGSTGNGVRIALNEFVAANICSKHDTSPDGTEFVGIGIIPDILINETPEQYFQSGEDPYIQTAIELLTQ